MSFQVFIQQSFSSIGFAEVIPSTIKTFFFGFAVGVIGCYEGYNADRGTASVGVAANTSVVISSLAIIIIDMINVQLTSILL
jgi:phospholipid/cholesterol/gamma-HCH transport system permease protein